MRYRVAAVNEHGDPVDLHLEGCWRCGCMINLMLVTMEEHVESAHPVTVRYSRSEPDSTGRHSV